MLVENPLSNEKNLNINNKNFNNLRGSNFYRDKTDTSYPPKSTNKFSYHMNLERTTIPPYEVIYYFILYDYAEPKYKWYN